MVAVARRVSTALCHRDRVLRVSTLYSTAPTPPIPKQKIRLSMSKPVLLARSNTLGGLQYSGTNSGSVKPKGVVNTLAQRIARR